MASEKVSFDASKSQGNSSQEIPAATTKYNMGKELARRALLRSHLRKNGRRKVASNGAKSLPSRLSKVSLGEDSAE
ncbi:hypothetical protein D0Y65_023118 [Glycine soja]|uniref:Uncharacterized protein n=1 Tax=Glycine soja TaxID=3848 RepID=A0A0B2PZC8_GLYSO|nr:hypothetical protein glysoja_029441 [Glycine soja]RZB90513.1 hypothetical protein D0Y65_023118 [Glycine soja]